MADMIILYKKPMKHKLKRWTLYFDILALFPQFIVLYFTPIYNNPEYEWIRIVYAIKIFKSHVFFTYLDSIFKKLNMDRDSDMARVIKLFIFLLVLIQLIG